MVTIKILSQITITSRKPQQGFNGSERYGMDVDDLGTVFTEKLDNVTISRLATLSESLRFFFEGSVPFLCREYNAEQEQEILELIYAGGDDLFLVGGWSALPEIAERIRSEFEHFVTGDHVTLSGASPLNIINIRSINSPRRAVMPKKQRRGLLKRMLSPFYGNR